MTPRKDGERIFVAGHRGLVGAALVRGSSGRAPALLLAARAELDLRDGAAVERFFAAERPGHVYPRGRARSAAFAPTRPSRRIYPRQPADPDQRDRRGVRHGVRKLLFLGSSCIYPRLAPQPIREDCLLTGPLEPTNEWYAIAKIAGIKMARPSGASTGSTRSA